MRGRIISGGMVHGGRIKLAAKGVAGEGGGEAAITDWPSKESAVFLLGRYREEHFA